MKYAKKDRACRSFLEVISQKRIRGWRAFYNNFRYSRTLITQSARGNFYLFVLSVFCVIHTTDNTNGLEERLCYPDLCWIYQDQTKCQQWT